MGFLHLFPSLNTALKGNQTGSDIVHCGLSRKTWNNIPHLFNQYVELLLLKPGMIELERNALLNPFHPPLKQNGTLIRNEQFHHH